MRKLILAGMMLAALAVGGCSTMMADLRYPLPTPEGEMRQLNKGLWQWNGESRVQ